eukprot:10622428-Alexandrium_andersonii.AAC.1
MPGSARSCFKSTESAAHAVDPLMVSLWRRPKCPPGYGRGSDPTGRLAAPLRGTPRLWGVRGRGG